MNIQKPSLHGLFIPSFVAFDQALRAALGDSAHVMKAPRLIGLLLFLVISCSQASTTIYSDTFARDGALAGSTPEVGPAGVQWWSGADLSVTSASDKDVTLSKMGVLPFSPEQGKVYTFSLKSNPVKGMMAAFGFFSKIRDIDSNWFDSGVSHGWMFQGPTGSTNVFEGPVTEKSKDVGVVGAGSGEFSEYSIVLDTTGSQGPGWVFEFYRGDKLLEKMVCETNPDIQFIAIGVLTTDDVAKFKDFSLVSEP